MNNGGRLLRKAASFAKPNGFVKEMRMGAPLAIEAMIRTLGTLVIVILVLLGAIAGLVYYIVTN